MKALFLVPYPTEGASNRIRVEQFLPYLRSKGLFCRVRPFFNRRFFSILYRPRHIAEKIFWFVVCSANRFFDVIRALGYDVIFIHREAYPLGGPFIERLLRLMGKPIVYDFDDAIFLANTSEQNLYIEKLKKPSKVPAIIAMSNVVIAGNEYLKEYAARYAADVRVIPSSVDTARFASSGPSAHEGVTIGWVGSNTTKNFLYGFGDVFKEVSKKYPQVRFVIVGARLFGLGVPAIVSKEWTLESEAREIGAFDIGIMPMPDNEWTRGKCAFKALLYMACAKPVVASPVGFNTAVIADGIDGFLALSKEEWVAQLSRLIEDPVLRRRIGEAARRKIEEKFSVEVNAPLVYRALMDAGAKHTR